MCGESSSLARLLGRFLNEGSNNAASIDNGAKEKAASGNRLNETISSLTTINQDALPFKKSNSVINALLGNAGSSLDSSIVGDFFRK